MLWSQLGSQPANVDVDCACAPEVVVAPHFLQQQPPVADAAGSLRQELQQLELLVSQVEWAATQVDLIVVGIDHQIAHSQHGGLLPYADPSSGEGKASRYLRARSVVQKKIVDSRLEAEGSNRCLSQQEQQRRHGRAPLQRQPAGGTLRRCYFFDGIEQDDVWGQRAQLGRRGILE